jgi:hypothetical protein
LGVVAAVAVAFGACDEQLDSGGACPALCPAPTGQIRDTTFVAIALDTSIAGFPSKGLEPLIYIASMQDTLQTRGIVRFDQLQKTFRHNNTVVDSNIVAIDTGSVIRVFVAVPDTTGVETTVEAYDVDLNGAEDSDPDAVGGAFTPDRLLGSRTFAASLLKDSLDIPIDPAKLLIKVQTDTPGNRLRVGLRVTSPAGSARLSILSTNGDPTRTPKLVFRPSAGDTSVPVTMMSPNSVTPSEPTIADALRDYLTVVQAPPPPGPTVLRVGGLPARRVYLRFDIPSRIIDSTDIVRATLELTQVPSPFAPRPADTIGVQQFAVSASANVEDLARALQLLVTARTDTVPMLSTDSGKRSFEMLEQVSFWRSTSPTKTPRAMALRLLNEGQVPGQADFFSIEAPADVRPSLRILYLPRREATLP